MYEFYFNLSFFLPEVTYSYISDLIYPNLESHPDMCPERALLVWAPNYTLKEEECKYLI